MPEPALEKLYEEYYTLVVYTEASGAFGVHGPEINKRFTEYIEEAAKMVGTEDVPLLHDKDTGITITSSTELETLRRKLVAGSSGIDLIRGSLTIGRLDAYFALQHQKNLEKIKTLQDKGEKRYLIKDILNKTGIKKTKFYELRKKKLIPPPYSYTGNSPYWLEDGYNKACKKIKKDLSKK